MGDFWRSSFWRGNFSYLFEIEKKNKIEPVYDKRGHMKLRHFNEKGIILMSLLSIFLFATSQSHLSNEK